MAECARCRAVVADLASAADSVLLLAPTIEPPPGFESRVLARAAASPVAPARRRWPRLAAAAAIVAAAAVGGGAG
jgi:hypothetical protein